MPTRSELPSTNKWNVEALYSDPSHWAQELTTIQGQKGSPRWPELKMFQGKLSDPKAVAAYMEKYLKLDRMLNKLYTYAHLRMDEDLGNDEFKKNYGLIISLAHDFQLETSWVEPELLSLSDREIQRLMQEPSLAPYRFALERIVRMKPHTLSSEKEELIALSGKALDATGKAFSALINADLTFKPVVDSNGQELPLSNGTYLSYQTSPNREIRKQAFVNLHEKYASYLNTICELIQGKVNAHVFNAKARKYPDSLTAATFGNQIDAKVVTRLIETIRKGRAAMGEYLDLRKEVLKVDQIHAYDLTAPLVAESRDKMTYAEACQNVIDSVAPLGAEYQNALRKGLLEERWVDPYESARKRSGAYSSGCYDSMPYILMNFHGNLRDVETLAHEAGHSMHSYLSKKNQPYIYSQYPIFVAEVASTFNELLLLDHLMKKAKTKQDRAFLLCDMIDRIRTTIVRQTLFAEFELKMHQMVEQGQPLTPSLLNHLYASLLKDYYGDALAIDPQLEVEWARIPHFYSNFYVYQYATGLSAAMALYEKAIRSTEARDRYLKFLSSGGSKYPLDLLKEAGVDMTSSAPIEAALKRFGELVKELRNNL
jgi:oligoendopeptidase F